MKKSKVLSLLLAFIFIVSMGITGCSQKNPQPVESTTAAITTVAATTATEKATAPAETVKLTFYGFSDWVDSDPFAAVYKAVKAQFEKENPGYVIELQSD